MNGSELELNGTWSLCQVKCKLHSVSMGNIRKKLVLIDLDENLRNLTIFTFDICSAVGSMLKKKLNLKMANFL